MKRIVWLLTVLLVLLGAARTAQAQTVVDANSGVQFQASADHAALADDGITAIVDHYELLICAQSNGSLCFTQHLLKPTPDAAGVITVQPVSSLATLARGVIYFAQVSAVGPGGTGTSGNSEPFLTPFAAPTAPGAPGIPVILR